MKFKAFSEDDFKLWGGAINAQIKQSKQGPPPRKVIDVMFLDGSKFPMTIDTASTTAEDLWWMVCETLRLPNEARECFFIWLLGSDMEMLLCNDDIVYDQVTKWHRAEKRYSDQALEGPPRVVFRTTPMLELKVERNLKDTKSVHLFYIQSVFYVLNGYYIVDLQQAITLAGFAAQARFGDFDSTKHGPGYISKYLHKFIPGWIMAREKQKPEMWEAAVAREHKKHAGKPLMIVELLYLQIVRGAPYYGSTFFSGKNRDRKQSAGYFNQLEEGYLGLGINMEGIHVFKKNKYMNSYPWKEISHWEIDQEKFFYFQSSVLDGSGFYAQYLIETKRAPLIRDLINDIVFELKREKKVIQSIRKRQSSAFDLVRRAAGVSVGASMKDAAVQDMAKGTFSDGAKPVERPRAVSRKDKQAESDSDSDSDD
eukprot:TRINITY_DN3692_c0_g1_i2.p1 TRINITY_DN3692_c0_g1~~TRINITY_DN3692_c0_g1_i2.p1  ORF type:complete len:425 (+),score=94.52 TRINITY_DN3692_c0_g1_i2:455-1729(+)